MSGDGVDVSKAQDGGCLKKILVEGEGDLPMAGMTAKVHYVGTLLDGSKFDSSRDRDEHFTFTLGKGQVIKGWDEGIATMKRGEKAILTCTPEYAYGASGSPPKIPPNSTLQFEVEMFDFYGEDCSENGDGGVRKTVINEGSGYACPREEATVTISYTARHLDRVIEERDVKFVMGDGSESGIVPGLELALYKMKMGEEARVSVKYPYGYGNSGNAHLAVPGGADLEYTVTLKDLDQPKYSYELSKAEKLEYSAKAKEEGTLYFKKGNYERALKKYGLIADYLGDGGNAGDSDDEEMEEDEETKKDEGGDVEGFTEKSQVLLIAAHSNQALCYIKLSNGKDASKSCDKVLEMDSKNVKALFRKGQAAELEQEYEEAIKNYQLLLEVEPSNNLANRQIVICRNKIKTYRDKQKKIYSNLFARTNFKDPEPTKDDNKIKPDFSDSEGEEEASVDVENTEINV